MEIYLVRHTEPDVAKGVCYGQTDIDVTKTFLSEASIIQKHLPTTVAAVYSSPLQRCRKLTEHLYPGCSIQQHKELMELNCGSWEMKKWDDIPAEEIIPWMNDFVNVCTPGGESYADLYKRVSKIFDQIHQQAKPAVVVAHGGVLRSILAYITDTALKDSFSVFTLHYGCVIKISFSNNNFLHEILSNIPHEKETHKPSAF
jgi:alpha-ribazole phosphatase